MSSLRSSLDRTIGALFIGFAVTSCIYGVLAAQVWSYLRKFPMDRPILKLTVAALLYETMCLLPARVYDLARFSILETVDQIFIGHLTYTYCITNFGDPLKLLKGEIIWSLVLQLTLGAVVGAIVKASFGWRVWRFSNHNYFVTGIIMFLTVAQLGLAVAFTVKSFQLPNLHAIGDLKVLGSFSLAAGVLTDVITAIALCWFLNKLRTGLASSDSLVNNLCRYAINTGALTSTISLTTLVLYNVNKGTDFYFIATYFVLSKLYAISYMATLNTRKTVRGRGTDKQGTGTTNHINNTNLFHMGTRINTFVHVQTEGWESKDYNDDIFPMNSFAPSSKPRVPV